MTYPTPPHTPSAANQYALKPTERAYASTARLNLQHYLWKDQTGYLLHPSIPLTGSHLKIADVGTGTGIWLLDLAKTLPPTAQLDGFDIDTADCPPKDWLPPNITFSVLDALGEIPTHLQGVYDVVQLRLFQVVVQDNDPGPLLRNVMKILKPGGYLQWGEYDMAATKTVKTDPSLNSTELEAIPAFVQRFKRSDGRVGVQNWIPSLASTFRQHNLISVISTRHIPTPASLPYQLDVYLLTYEELSFKTLDTLEGDHGEYLRELIAKASGEGRRGVAWAMERQVVVGRKPLGGGSDGVGVDQNARILGGEEGRGPLGDKVSTGGAVGGDEPVLGKWRSRRRRILRIFQRKQVR